MTQVPTVGPGGSPGARPRVVCIDDDTPIREAVHHLLPEVEVVAVHPRVEAYLADPVPVDVVLLDLLLLETGERGVQGAHGVAAVAATGAKVLIYTNERRREVLAGCFAAGAQGIAHKSDTMRATQEAVKSVAAGRLVLTTALAGLAELLSRRGALRPLSPRKVEVLRGRARGESYKSIAARLFIAPATAEEYMSEVSRTFAGFLSEHSAADLERHLGIGPGDLLDPYGPGPLSS